jgi:hypothetical protein
MARSLSKYLCDRVVTAIDSKLSCRATPPPPSFGGMNHHTHSLASTTLAEM